MTSINNAYPRCYVYIFSNNYWLLRRNNKHFMPNKTIFSYYYRSCPIKSCRRNDSNITRCNHISKIQ